MCHVCRLDYVRDDDEVGLLIKEWVELFFVRTDRDCHVWCKIYTCRITVNFGTLKDENP